MLFQIQQALPSGDIRLASANTAEMMSTSFSTSPKDWDSDGDDDSSEEFMYVKGTDEASSNTKDTTITLNSNTKDQEPGAGSSAGADNTDVMESEVWNVHTDQVMVSPTTSMKLTGILIKFT